MKVKRTAREKMLRKALRENGISLKWKDWEDHQKFGMVVAVAAGMEILEGPEHENTRAEGGESPEVVQVIPPIVQAEDQAWGVDPREDEMLGMTDPADD
jgi:hypothetical protein